MIIEIHRPELEALIAQRVKSGGFQNVEEALWDALSSAPEGSRSTPEARTGADLIAALQSSPCRELEIEPGRYQLPIRDVEF